MTFKPNILSNYAKYFKKLVPYYVLSFFTILKSLYPTGQPAYLEKITLVWEKLVIYLETIIYLEIIIYREIIKHLKIVKHFETTKHRGINTSSISKCPLERQGF